VRIGVHPAAELEARPRLFGALAEAFGVRFEPADAATAQLVLNGDTRAAGAERRLVMVGMPPAGEATVRFGDSPLLDARLRGWSLVERAAPASLRAEDGDEVLATAGERPVWVRRGADDVVAATPAELGPAEFLRDRVDPGRFLALVPLVQFLRELTAAGAWEPPPTRAAFVVDDPNLHWRSYGHLRYPDLVAHARDHGYHLAVATVPIDGWYAHRPTVRLLRSSGDVLSLCVHGNDHRMHELGRLGDVDEARRVLAQSARRIGRFERRTGLSVSRVVVPPFEACSAASAQAMLELGFEGLSHTRPYPWTPLGGGESSHAAPDPARVLSGWRSAELVEGGLPVFIRREFREHDEVVLRAFLDQPVVLYGHVSDFEAGLEPLAAAARLVNSLPSVTWGSLGAIAETSFAQRREGSVLAVRPFARRIRLQVGPEVSTLRLEGPPHAELRVDGARADRLPAERSGPVEADIRWPPARRIEPARVPRPAFAPHPRARRLLVEARDRLDPLARRLRTTGRR
jgi:hypothetical protein